MNLFKILPLRPLYGLSHPLIQACYPLCGSLFLLFTPFRPRTHLSPLDSSCFQPYLYLLSFLPICYLFCTPGNPRAHLLSLIGKYHSEPPAISHSHLLSLVTTCYTCCPTILSLMFSCPPFVPTAHLQSIFPFSYHASPPVAHCAHHIPAIFRDRAHLLPLLVTCCLSCRWGRCQWVRRCGSGAHCANNTV